MYCCFLFICCGFFFKQKTAYEMRISDWSSDGCSSDLLIELIVCRAMHPTGWNAHVLARELLSPSSHLDVLFEEEMPPKFRIVAGILGEISGIPVDDQIGRASCRGRVGQYV